MNKHRILTATSSFVFALLIVCFLLFFLQKNPLDFLFIIFTGFFTNPILLVTFFTKITPLIFATLAVAFAFRAGLFNIGAEGQLLMGMFGAIIIGIIPGIPTFIHLPLVLMSGFFFGALWGAIPGILKAFFQVHEVVISIMLNYIGFYLLKDQLLPLYGDPEKSKTLTYALLDSATLDNLTSIQILGISLNEIIFFCIGLLAILLFYIIISKTKLGFELRAVGSNKFAARYAGMKSKRNIILAMLISGGFAGIGGAFYIINLGAIATNGFEMTNVGFDGLAAALLGSSMPLGSLVGSLILSYLSAISLEIQQVLAVPKEITDIIIALILFFIAIGYFFDQVWDKILRFLPKKKIKVKKGAVE